MSVLSQLSNEERNLLLLYHRGGALDVSIELSIPLADVGPRLRAVKTRVRRLAAAEHARTAAATALVQAAATLEVRP